MKFIKDPEGDLLNLDLVRSIHFESENDESNVTICFSDGNDATYDINKKSDISKRLKFDEFVKTLQGLCC